MSPFQGLLSAARAGFRALRTLSPKLLPLIICLVVIPLLMLASLTAGWVVWRSVPKGFHIPVYLTYGDGRPPYSDIVLPKLISNQRYDISLHLTVPACEPVYAVGNFMTSLVLVAPSNKTLVEVRRPSLILPPPSRLLSFLSPRLIQHVIPLLVSFSPGNSNAIAKIEIGRRDGWKSLGIGEGRELSVVSAFLTAKVLPHGILGILSRFPLITTFAAAITFFVFSLVALAVILLPSFRSEQVDNEPPAAVAGGQDTLRSRSSGSPGSQRSSSLGSLRGNRRQASETFTPLSQVSSLPSPSPEPESPGSPMRQRLRRLAVTSSDSE